MIFRKANLLKLFLSYELKDQKLKKRINPRTLCMVLLDAEWWQLFKVLVLSEVPSCSENGNIRKCSQRKNGKTLFFSGDQKVKLVIWLFSNEYLCSKPFQCSRPSIFQFYLWQKDYQQNNIKTIVWDRMGEHQGSKRKHRLPGNAYNSNGPRLSRTAW